MHLFFVKGLKQSHNQVCNAHRHQPVTQEDNEGTYDDAASANADADYDPYLHVIGRLRHWKFKPRRELKTRGQTDDKSHTCLTGFSCIPLNPIHCTKSNHVENTFLLQAALLWTAKMPLHQTYILG